LSNQWVCSSIAQVVVGNIVAVPYDEADNLVVGTPEYAATAIFEKTVSRSDRELQKARDLFRKKVSLYRKMFSGVEELSSSSP
jgi:predicted secreted protein